MCPWTIAFFYLYKRYREIKGSAKLFADDCLIIYSNRNVEINLKIDLYILEKYFDINILTLNDKRQHF